MHGCTDLVIALHAADGEAARVGGKAATLGLLARAGLAVPEGLVLATDGMLRTLHAAGLRGDTAPDEVRGAPLPEEVAAAIVAVADHFGDAELAVRSSSVAEDRTDASFAGQYETVLHVEGIDALRAAVRRCWASAYGERVRAYRRSRGQSGAASPVAVLVQRMVDADVAGVAFTANPVSGARDEVLVSAVPGLGDDLTSGERSPDEWVVRGEDAVPCRVAHQALTGPLAIAVAGVARRAEAILGGAQDVEWAMAGGRLLVLQSRPVTAIPERPAVDLPAGTWLKEVGRYPEPLTPLGESVALGAVGDGLSAMQAEFGGLVERVDLRSVGGEVYVRATPVGGRGGTPPWWLFGLLARLAPPLRRRVRVARRMVRPEVLDGFVARWEREWLPELRDSASRLRAIDLTALDDAALRDHLDATVHLLHGALRVHFRLIPSHAIPLHALVLECGRSLHWTPAQTLDLVAGTSTVSAEPSRELAELARAIRANPAALAVTERADADIGTRLAVVEAGLAVAFAAWCSRYAGRAINDDPGSPTLAERPWALALLLRAAVRDAAAAGSADDVTADLRAAAVRRAHAGLARRSTADRRRFEALLARTRRSYPIREGVAFWTASLPCGLVRRAALEVGRRLTVRGALACSDDAVFCGIETLRAALGGAQGPDIAEQVRRNRAERAWVRANPGPERYGPPPAQPPDVRALPASARRINAALLWAQREQQPLAVRPSENESAVVGIAGSPGRYTGAVRIVRGEADFCRLCRGEVLVCPTTDPSWSVLFGTAGALVTDGGGLLSHPAIIAREHAIPAVLGTACATRQLSDGDVVTVDGTTGRVVLEHHAAHLQEEV